MPEIDEAHIRPFGEVAAEIGHELNNQLGIVSGRAELARLYLDRGRVEDVRAGVDVILRQMDRMRLLSERLRGMRQEPRALHAVDLRGLLRGEFEQGLFPALASADVTMDDVPMVFAHPETLHEVVDAIRKTMLERASRVEATPVRIRLLLAHEEGANTVSLTFDFEGLGVESARGLFGEVTRLLAPTGLGLRADFPDGRAHFQVEFPLVDPPR